MIQNNIRLFDIFRARRRHWTLGLITMLVGSWISVFCVNCFAAIDSARLDVNGINNPEQHCLLDRNKDDNNQDNNCCDKGCDDDSFVATSINSYDKQQSIFKQYSTDYTTLNSAESLFSLQFSDVISTSNYQTPERSCFLPLERFCVLLN